MSTHVSRYWVLVLVKEKEGAKSRLADVLDNFERISLQEAMLADVLAALCQVKQLDGVVVCSPDSSYASFTEAHGALFIRQPEDVLGMNGAATFGAAAVAQLGADIIGVVPGDLPFLDARDVEAALDAVSAHNQTVIIPDQSGQGTNGMFFCASNRPDFSFGPGSFNRHLNISPNQRAVPMFLGSIACDIDTPADLDNLTLGTQLPPRQTQILIHNLGSSHPRNALTRSYDRP